MREKTALGFSDPPHLSLRGCCLRFLAGPFYYSNRRLLLAPVTSDDLLFCFRTNGTYSLANGTWYIEAQRPSSMICILDLEVQLVLFSIIQLLDTGVHNIYIRLESQ